MDCEAARSKIQEALDVGRRDAETEAHLEGCPACRDYAAAVSGVDALLRDDPVLEWDPALTASTVLRLRRSRSRQRIAAAVTAAALLLAAWFGGNALLALPVAGEATREVAGRVASPGALRDAAGDVSSLAATVRGGLDALPLQAGTPVALAALAALLLLNGAVLAAQARRRES